MSETAAPLFVAQAIIHGDDERQIWVRDRCVEGRARGCKYFRASTHPYIAGLILVEGWKIHIGKGAPNWSLVATLEPQTRWWTLDTLSPRTTIRETSE